MKEPMVTNCERSFVKKAISEGYRLDGRSFDEWRQLTINFGNDWGCVFVSLGETKALAQVSCEVALPKQTRPNEGLLNINVELSPMASPNFEVGRFTEESVQINRLLEKSLKDSRAVDLESLCIVAEEKVWAIRVNVTVMNHEGNIMDCVSIAALTALTHFKRPDVTTTGEQIIIHTLHDKDPLPIVIHHYPVCVTYAVFGDNNTVVADPSVLEENVADAQLVFGVNAFRELCGLHLGGKALMRPDLVISCAGKSAARAVSVVQIIKEAVAKDAEERASGKPIGFNSCIYQNKLTALASERIPIKLKKWSIDTNIIKNKLPGNGYNKHIRFADDIDEKMNEDDPSAPSVNSIGVASAEVITETTKFGEGNKNTWVTVKGDLSDSESSSDEEDQKNTDKKITDNLKIEKNSTIDNNVILIDSESSEEEVVLLEQEVVKIDLTEL